MKGNFQMRRTLRVETLEDALLAASQKPNVAGDYVDTIDRLYRVAISDDPSPRNRIAYGRYLAEHGQFIRGMREFGKILDDTNATGNTGLLAEIVRHITWIETRLENDDSSGRSELWSVDNWQDGDDDRTQALNNADDRRGPASDNALKVSDFFRQIMDESEETSAANVSNALAGLDSRILREVTDLLTRLRSDRLACEQRRTGLTLLKLARCCGRHNQSEIEVACIRKAICCFAQAAAEIQGWRDLAQTPGVSAN